ncbi:MAG: class I SAM-dependent methyltransferase [Myxococcaceae bacterium]|nr:class I SAM-dependent methyltransferase [Myxococcaceae bacterium]
MALTFHPDGIEAYAEAHSDPESPLLAELAKETAQTFGQLSRMQVGRLEGAFLTLVTKLVGARRVLEVGTFTGCSALCFAAGLPDDGEVITCDIEPKHVELAQRYFQRSPLGRKIHVRLGDAVQTLGGLSGPFDVVFLDADKGNYQRYYELALPLLRSGGLLLADNTLWSGRVLKPQDEDTRALAAFNDAVAQDARVERVVLTLRDGVTMVRKR